MGRLLVVLAGLVGLSGLPVLDQRGTNTADGSLAIGSAVFLYMHFHGTLFLPKLAGISPQY